MKQGTFLNPQHINEQETYEIKLFKRLRGNSAYVYDNTPILVFKARPATQMETKLYRITKGVNSSTNGITLYCSNLPNEVEVEDRVEFMGKIMLVKNIGFFYNDNKMVNASAFSNEYLALRSPKGVTLG